MRSIPSKAPAWALASIFLFSITPTVAAHTLASPSDFTATPDGTGFLLSWGPPEGEDPDGYRVYLEGTLAATPVDASVWVPAATSYAVTAVYETYAGGSESMAAVIVGADADTRAGCSSTTINGTPPFVHPRFHWECLDPVWKIVEDLLGSVPFSLPLQVEFRP